jgi:hypothetical protein
VTHDYDEMAGPDVDEIRRRERDTARVVAVADVYVMTNRIDALLEDRLLAIERAVDAGATADELHAAMGGSRDGGEGLPVTPP